ncbi:MAG: choice-of-anchor D domain-containing protein, partial [candidate division Zixibacteria bacterium]|nr:choice-of-anchor D domain-containing protein [candidate division Zixibacteria bacterium]NIW44404.1 choice-of-anchor D domain-containing protein [Gammaproteobacteria bacterium]NIS45407.1 choice-of-anchor D domain-containing protein [candidate division Zixibacteria bacterium]NIU13546.1 choice-of-anchor D domain-containing protein [candidate division Zixibacteria bacterium]NIV05564.1 choice-of-anchor D domain-containing protein [candidate division Zixibacteria bacterium]
MLPDIAASDSSLEFGEVLVGTDSLASLQISNEGTGTLNVTDADIVGPQNDQYSLPNFQPFSIPPGGNPVPISVQFSPTSMGIKNAFLIITHNDENENPLQIPLSGRGIRPIISVNPQELEFGDVSVNSDSLLSIDIKNEGDADLVINDTSLIGINADQFAVVNLPQLPFTIPVGNDSVVITIRFSPTATGIKTAQLRIFNNDPFQNPFPVLMNGRGVLPDISLSPDTLHFGDVNVGNASIRTTFISNVGTSDLIVTDTSLIGIDADLFSVLEMPELPITLAPNTEPVPITIRFNPDSLGMKVARFQIFSNDPDENPVNLELTGTGVQPGIAVNPTQLDFGNVRVNRDSLLTLEVINDGTADLIVIDTAIVGSDPDLFSITTLPDLPFVIEPGGEPEKFTLRFSPDSLGAASAILHITSNDPNMEVLETPLQGNGVQPDIAASVDSLNFGQVLVASDSIIFFQLKNVGGSRLRVDNLAIAGTDTALFTIDSIPDLPFHIQPGDSVLTSLRFSPDTVGSKFAQLQIFSDDPDEFLYAIPLTGSGVAPEIVVDRDSLDFGFVKLNTDSIMSIRITNTGTAPLRVYDLGFGGRPPVPFFIANAPQLPFTVDALDDTVEILIGFSPRLQSKVFNVLYIISNDPYNPQQSLLLSAEGVRGPVIEDISLSEVRLRQDLTVTTTVSADTTIQSVRVKYAANNTNLFSTPIILTPQNGDVYSGTIAGENVSELGLKLALIVTDAYPTRSTDTLYAEVIIPEDAVTHTFNDTLLNRWQMFSVPYNLSDASIGTVLEELGEEGDFSWRIYRTDSSGVSSNYFDSQQLQTMGTYGRFEPGNSFWLYLRDDEDGQVPTNTLSFPQMQTVPGDSFSYTVQPGWNQIGLPYSFTMSWNQVESSEKDSL